MKIGSANAGPTAVAFLRAPGIGPVRSTTSASVALVRSNSAPAFPLSGPVRIFKLQAGAKMKQIDEVMTR
jgi:hypothetical protein